ncbi:minor tail protein [Microbacterium phage Kenzers]|uniref:minor tail protein n=1 Tax=Microbacterium phage Kenzers TaxID=2927243 RepID=UPI00220B46EC|nr:minor tail protein [Microbacterium phage Kenzers]UVT31649.1 minor tail protein [Microbacterium phage Kenzers]
MALTAYPFDAQAVTEQQYGDLFGSVAQSGILGAPTANNFKVTAAGSSMALTVTSVSGASRALLRGHALLMTTNETVTVEAANTSARADLVVLRLDYAANSIGPAIRKGTAGNTTPPAPVWGTGGIYEIPLASVLVGANVTTISSGNVTDLRRFTGPTTGVWTTVARPTTPLSFGYNTTLSRWEFTLDGTTWDNIGYVNLADSTQVTGTLPVARGGTGQTTLQGLSTALGLGTIGQPIPVANGGTGGTTLQALRTALELGTIGDPLPISLGGTGQVTAAGISNALGLGNTITGAIPVSRGGTGQTTLQGLSTALGLGTIGQPIPVANGGTGATNRDGIRAAIDLRVTPNNPGHAVGRIWLKTS